MNHPKFGSLGELFRELRDVIKIARANMTALRRQRAKFRETISLAVTYANSCSV